MTENILLGFLMERSMTGYDMKQHMSISTSYFADASFGSIYPALKKLMQNGLIEGQETAENGKLKKIYSISQKGKAEFLRWLDSPIEASKSNVSSAMVKIFFYRYLPDDRAKSLISQYIKELETYKNSLLNLKSKFGGKMEAFELSTLDFGLDYYDFVIRWQGEHFINQ